MGINHDILCLNCCVAISTTNKLCKGHECTKCRHSPCNLTAPATKKPHHSFLKDSVQSHESSPTAVVTQSVCNFSLLKIVNSFYSCGQSSTDLSLSGSHLFVKMTVSVSVEKNSYIAWKCPTLLITPLYLELASLIDSFAVHVAFHCSVGGNNSGSVLLISILFVQHSVGYAWFT